jgi:tRNA 2-thiouridine synthesizing protein A
MSDIAIDERLDASGLTCPLPLLKAKQALNGMAAGRVLEIVCTDPGSVRDFKVFAEQSGNDLLKSEESAGTYTYWLRKSGG